jgi:RNA polymerase sigma-70 factor, ECF subfamily
LRNLGSQLTFLFIVRHTKGGKKTYFAMDGCLRLSKHVPSGGTPVEGADERELIHRAQSGDRAAFDDLVRQYDQQVLRLIMRVVPSPDEAHDLYQEVFLKVFRSLNRFRSESRFSTWLYRVATNVCFDHLRRTKSREEVQAPASDDGQDTFFQALPDGQPARNPERALWAGEIRRRIHKALKRLGPRERMVFELRHFQGMRLHAIGEMCGTSEETAKNSLFRATRKLRQELGDLI